MTNNFLIICRYMSELGIVESKADALNTDLFFDVELIRRGKDHPNLPAANYTLKTYYFDNLETYAKSFHEITTLCRLFGLRAYVSVNVKSKQEASKRFWHVMQITL